MMEEHLGWKMTYDGRRLIMEQELQGDSKIMQEFFHITRTVVACEPCHRITNHFFLLKTEIHTQILHTEPFLSNFIGLRY